VDLAQALAEQEQAWRRRALLRRVYADWYRAIVDRLSPVAGRSIELGSGIGQLRQFAGDKVVLTDVEKTAWVDERIDALRLPDADGSLANIVMLDVFHHLADPARFLDEADRTLRVGGRVIMVEPYCSPVSTPLYRRFHHERTDVHADPFAPDITIAAAPLDSNQARPTLVFYRHRSEFVRRWPELRLVEERRFAIATYPLTGGFSHRELIPAWLYLPLNLLERVLSPLAPILAFRCLIVLERCAKSSGTVRHDPKLPEAERRHPSQN
jgi:SAM-dependent methyltransferase